MPAQRPRPHRRQVGDQQCRQRSMRPLPGRHESCWRGLDFTEHGGGQIQQPGARDELFGTAVGRGGGQCRPVIGRLFGQLEKRGNRLDVVGARQRERAPAVPRGHQPGRSAGRDPPGGRQPEQSGPPGEDFVGVDAQGCPEIGCAAADVVGRPPRPDEHGIGYVQGAHQNILHRTTPPQSRRPNPRRGRWPRRLCAPTAPETPCANGRCVASR